MSHSPLRRSVVHLAAATALACLASSAAAQDSTRGVRLALKYAPGTKPGVVVLPVNGEVGDSIRTMLQRDFDFGDRINVIAWDSAGTDSSADGSRSSLNYPLFARLGAAAVVQPTMTAFGIHVAVHDVAQQKVERVKDFPLEGEALSPEWRLSVHHVADEMETWLTGVPGIAATRILYADGNPGRVWQIDSDGANPRLLVPTPDAMSPVWFPRATHIAYITMGDDGQRVIIRELGGATRVLRTPPGNMNSTPVFSPDGSTIMYAHGAENGIDLYATDPFGSEPARKVTVSRGDFINTSPTFSPDGRRIAFTSNRNGHPEVYISDADGTNAQILTYMVGDQSYRTDPNWSPDGRLIAFQSQLAGRFQIMTISLLDRTVRQLTSEGINENPWFAPDSRHIVFTSDRTGARQLFVVDMESGRVRQLTHAPRAALYGAWSPPLRSR